MGAGRKPVPTTNAPLPDAWDSGARVGVRRIWSGLVLFLLGEQFSVLISPAGLTFAQKQ